MNQLTDNPVIETTDQQIETLSRLELPTVTPVRGERIAFLGCGDSLAAARGAELLGHRVISAGDIAWSGTAPAGVDSVVALSWTGKTAATLIATEIAAEAGLVVRSITSDPASPIARLSAKHVQLPQTGHRETIPALGYALHFSLVQALCGQEPAPLSNVAEHWSRARESAVASVAGRSDRPEAITIASLPDVRGAAEFWSLKVIEATGVAVRVPALEETGHVDYFLGPQRHLTVLLAGLANPRTGELGTALRANGQEVLEITMTDLLKAQVAPATRELVGGLLGVDIARALAMVWERPPFRGGAVDLSGNHIQVHGGLR